MGDRYDEPAALGTAQRSRTPVRPEPSVDVARSADPAGRDPAALLALQRLAGNASVSRMLAPEDETEGGGASSPVLDVVGKGGGSPLDGDLRAEMEGRLGADFGDVRVHADGQASESARAVDAHAYTVGNDVVFRSDRWAPESTEGRQTLAHELSHVVQQRAGPVAGTETGDGIRLSDPADQFEQAADATAKAVMADPAPLGAAAAPSAAPSAQRQGEEEEEEVQTLRVQRQGEDEEEEDVQTLRVQREQDEEEEEETAQTLRVQRAAEESEPLVDETRPA
jgi:Domain of unknown function (DUF4157)